MKNKRQKCYRFVICLQFYKSHAFNEVIEYSVHKCRHLFNAMKESIHLKFKF